MEKPLLTKGEVEFYNKIGYFPIRNFDSFPDGTSPDTQEITNVTGLEKELVDPTELDQPINSIFKE